MPRLIAVTGATGALGRRVVDRLADRDGVQLRLVVRDAARAPRVPGAEVAAVPAGYADGPGLTAALTGVHTLYLVSAAEAADRLQQHLTAVAAAAAAGVQRVVYTSFLGAAPDAVFTLARQHAATEEALAATGLRTTVLRHAMYADFVPFFATIGDLDTAFALAEGYYFDRGRYAPPAPREFGPLTRRESAFLFMPNAEALRRDRRFKPLLAELKLEEYWRRTNSAANF